MRQKSKLIKQNLTIDQCLDTFFSEYIEIYLKKHTIKSYRSFRKNYLSPTIGCRKITTICFDDIQKIHFNLKDKPTTANRVLALCSSFFSWCEKKNFIKKGSFSLKGLERYQEKAILKFLNQEQMADIWEAILRLESSQKLRPLPATAFKLLMLTGARKNEILSLKWSDIDLNNCRAVKLESKTGFKVIYLPDQAIDILKKMDKTDIFVFTSKSSTGHLFDLQWQWRYIVEEAKLEGRWRIHDLRHGFASAAVNNGGTLSHIGFLLGHKRPSTTAKYAHVAENPAQKLLNNVANIIVKSS
jgi:integrase